MKDPTHLGLDVHKDTIAVAVLRPGTVVPDERVIPNTPEAIRRLVARLEPSLPLLACYEAGPTGYDTYRLLTDLGVACEVVAPALVPRRPGFRVKTDRLDARNLARLHRAGELSAVRVPSPQEEAARDLVRLWEELTVDRRRAQQRLKSFLLRQARRYPGTARGWSAAYELWARAQGFSEPNTQSAFSHALATLDARRAELQALEHELGLLAESPALGPGVSRLHCLKGIGTLSALTLLTEVCDFNRFPTAQAFMAFTGLVPSEHSSGSSERRGAITKTGNRRLRRVLVEGAWAYRHRPCIGPKLRRRSETQPPEVLAYCWKAQLRLHGVYRRIAARKRSTVAVVAVARELAGFCWGLMTNRM